MYDKKNKREYDRAYYLVAPCCTPCNFMKKSMSREEFLDHIRSIAIFQKF